MVIRWFNKEGENDGLVRYFVGADGSWDGDDRYYDDGEYCGDDISEVSEEKKKLIKE